MRSLPFLLLLLLVPLVAGTSVSGTDPAGDAQAYAAVFPIWNGRAIPCQDPTVDVVWFDAAVTPTAFELKVRVVDRLAPLQCEHESFQADVAAPPAMYAVGGGIAEQGLEESLGVVADYRDSKWSICIGHRYNFYWWECRETSEAALFPNDPNVVELSVSRASLPFTLEGRSWDAVAWSEMRRGEWRTAGTLALDLAVPVTLTT